MRGAFEASLARMQAARSLVHWHGSGTETDRVDLAKNVSQLHGASMTGQPQLRKELSRQSFPRFMAEQPPAML
jgi:hypothetical protein